jgi:pilus assembly protein CpaD
MTRMRDTGLARRTALGSLARISLPALALAALLAGCHEQGELGDAAALQLSDPAKRHQVRYSRRTETMAVAVPKGGGSLASGLQADVRRFLGRYKADGAGPLRVSLPNGTHERLAAAYVIRDIDGLARSAGIEPRAVEYARHPTNPDVGPTLQLSYERPVVVLPKCGEWPEDSALNHERLPYPNFGCATERNLALITANPRDLLQPQEESARSSERRSVGWSGYTSPGEGGGKSGGGGGSGDAKASPAPMTK